MLSITSRTLFTTFLATTAVGKLWGRLLSASTEGDDAGTSTCGAVQKTIQLTFPDPSVFPDHRTFVRAVAHGVAAAGDLITEDCSECIVEQFAEGIPILQQQSCGPVVLPTQSCEQASVTAKEIETATVLALGAAPDAWGGDDGQQFELMTILVEEILGCLLTEPMLPLASSTSTTSTQAVVAPSASAKCITTGVNYCGPKNSLWYPVPILPTVAPCLNQACFLHDDCYSEHCILSSYVTGCIFTSQTREICDQSLLAVCESPCVTQLAPTDPLYKKTKFVCDLVKCYLGGPVCDPSLQPNPRARRDCIIRNQNCAASYVQRSSRPNCILPAPQRIDCHGTSPCGSTEGPSCPQQETCCPCGQSCAHGSCQCGPQQAPCLAELQNSGRACCPPGQLCSSCGGGCTPCAGPGLTACGTQCCCVGEVCSGGSCVGACPPGETPQNGICTCGGSQCSANQICCPFGYNGISNPHGPSCCPASYSCCPSYTGPTFQGGSCCPPLYDCCPFVNNIGCCPPGSTCCIGAPGQSNSCCQIGQECCPGAVNGLRGFYFCCPPGMKCVGVGTPGVACV
jgi:hypothetical protein